MERLHSSQSPSGLGKQKEAGLFGAEKAFPAFPRLYCILLAGCLFVRKDYTSYKSLMYPSVTL